MIKSAHIQYRLLFSCFPEIYRRVNPGEITDHRTALISAVSVSKGKRCRPPDGWFLSLPASQSRSDPTHSRHHWQRDRADLMVTDGALRRPRSCLLTGHKRYTRNTVIPRFRFTHSKHRCRCLLFWMSEALRSCLGRNSNSKQRANNGSFLIINVKINQNSATFLRSGGRLEKSH